MKVAFVHIKDRKVLVALNEGNDTWFLPGGLREAGGTEEQTLIREVKEELAVDILPDSIEYLDTFEAQAFGAPARELVTVACYSASFEGELTATSEIAKIDFFSYGMRDRTSAPTQLLLDDLKRQGRIT